MTSSPPGGHPRRRFVAQAAGAAALLAGCRGAPPVQPPGVQLTPPGGGPGSAPSIAADLSAVPEPGLVEQLARRTFRYFWETADPATGLMPDRHPTRSPSSIAGIGFALSAYAIGVGRGDVTRREARERTLTTLRFLSDLPQGPQPRGVAGFKGFFYHFLDLSTGLRSGDCELSTVDTALLLCGALHARQFFDSDSSDDAEIRRLADALVDRVDWRWAQPRPPAIALGWSPEKGFLPYDWQGYNEAAVLYLLALGAREYPVDASAWAAWTDAFRGNWATFNGSQALQFPSLFGHQYSNVWVDFRGIVDPFMKQRGTDYFENSRRAAYAQRAYAILNPKRWEGYAADVWGLTACDGPVDLMARWRGELRRFRGYYARGAGPKGFDDGTIAPTAAAASIAVAPEIAVPAIEAMITRYGRHIYTPYGFLDAFNPSFRETDVPLKHGRVIDGFGWVATDHLAIDQGPILAMIANFTDGAVWRAMDDCEHLRRGLRRAGFAGGWLETG